MVPAPRSMSASFGAPTAITRQQSVPQAGRRAAWGLAAAGAAAACAVGASQGLRLPELKARLRQRGGPRPRPRLNWMAVDALAGAVGEVASLAVLYPLDSIKVLCQARGASTHAVLRELRALGCSGRTLRTLYAGCGSSMLCSAAIGAAYLLVFYGVKRAGSELSARHRAMQAAAAAAQQQQTRQQRPRQQQRQHSSSGRAEASSSGGIDGGTPPLVATIAGLAASVLASVFEAPMETFKLRTQAGALEGPMLHNMARAASSGGLGSLYSTYAAFVLKSVPYDVAELLTYSQLCDWRDAAAAGSSGGSGGARSSGGSGAASSIGAALASTPQHVGDALIGAFAGVASVLVSMPCDVIKTRMDLAPLAAAASSASGARGGLLCSARAFVDTGRALLLAGGPAALFVGVGPRLLQTVPSCCVYWAAVEGTRRALSHAFEVEGAPAHWPAAAAPAAA